VQPVVKEPMQVAISVKLYDWIDAAVAGPVVIISEQSRRNRLEVSILGDLAEDYTLFDRSLLVSLVDPVISGTQPTCCRFGNLSGALSRRSGGGHHPYIENILLSSPADNRQIPGRPRA
jgi:hypothetical protein